VTRRNPATADAGLAVLVFGLSLALLAGGGFGDAPPGSRPLDGLGVLLTAAATLPLAARRLAPPAVYAATVAASLVLMGLNYPLDVPFGPVVSVYTLGERYGGAQPTRRALSILAALGFVPLTAAAYAVGGYDVGHILVPELLIWLLFLAGTWLAGDRARLRRERIAELEERARRIERDADRERRLAAAEERTRIARELHDSAGHAINVILVQAGAARLLRDRNPEGSQRAIEVIEEVARGTIGEIDRLVRALRAEAGPEPPEPADPAAIEDLLRRYRDDGLEISADLRGTGQPLPRSVAWAAYRIVQESLTNAARHGTGRAEVAVRSGPAAVEIRVANPVAPGRSAGGGHGIVGMRERATLLGGTLSTDVDRDTFRLTALLPIGAGGDDAR
jgi:signal transduction histidine kinase